MSIIEERLPFLETVKLESGGHSPDGRYCVMEASAYLAGEPWSDAPACVSPVIRSFLLNWNDSLNDEDRQMLKPLVPIVIGTATSKKDEKTRAWMCTDWLARECAPAFLRAAGLTGQAELLENLEPLKSAASARKAQPTLNHQARKDTVAAWAAAWNAAGDAAAEDAAGAAAGNAAWAAARAAASAWDAAEAAAWDAAGNAAGNAAEAAAGAAAWDALRPTVEILQPSAVLLVERMCAVGR